VPIGDSHVLPASDRAWIVEGRYYTRIFTLD
jgi:hypothetical protein